MKKPMTTITTVEKALLRLIVLSDSVKVNSAVWFNYTRDHAIGGTVLTSLLKKGLIKLDIVPVSMSSNSTISLTKKGRHLLSNDL